MLLYKVTARQCEAGLKTTVPTDGGDVPQLVWLQEMHGERVNDVLAAHGMTVCDRSYNAILFAVNRAVM